MPGFSPGATTADSAQLTIDGEPVLIATPRDAQRLGIGIIHQELDLFPSLTAGENIVIGNLCFSGGSIDRFSRPFLEQVGLTCGAAPRVESLSIAQRQLLAIARALSMNVRILLMDEPTSSLFGDAVERLFALIHDLRQRGVAIVYVSHKMDEIFRLADRITVLRDGETIDTLDAAVRLSRRARAPDGRPRRDCNRTAAADTGRGRARGRRSADPQTPRPLVRAPRRRGARRRRTGRVGTQRARRRPRSVWTASSAAAFAADPSDCCPKIAARKDSCPI